MAVTHSTAAQNAATAAVLDLLDADTDPGMLVLRTSGNIGAPGTEVATLTFDDPAFGAPSSGTATANTVAPDTNATGNVSPVATATLEDGAGVVVIHCAVAASGSDINISGGTTVNPGDTVELDSLTYTALTA